MASNSSESKRVIGGATTRTAYRTHNNGELRISDVGAQVTLCGWVQTVRDLNHFCFIDVRDRYGVTQLVFPNPEEDDDVSARARELYNQARVLGREFVISAKGDVRERISKTAAKTTGDIEVVASELVVLNESKTPPFKIEDKTDGLEELRMQYRYLDIRRNPVKNALILRSEMAREVRNYLCDQGFLEVETPVLIKSTPEGARDFVVPSRMNPGCFYALPQSPQTFKQVLMVAGIDRYFQIVKCFRDEELRADRQPEFTQIDCEMAFVQQEDILNIFEGFIRHIFQRFLNHSFEQFPRMTWKEAMEMYGSDKPDTRFEMKLHEVTNILKGKEEEKGLKMFEEADVIIAISIPGLASYSKKKLKGLEKLAKGEQVGASALVYVKVVDLENDKFDSPTKEKFSVEDWKAVAEECKSSTGDLICMFCGPATINLRVREMMGKFRAIVGQDLGFRSTGYNALWVTDFPLLEYDEEEKRFSAMHHPFTSPNVEDMEAGLLDSNPGSVRSSGYDMVINGMEVGGGSVRIFDRKVQMKMFELLGFTEEAANEQFGFLMGAFEYGAPPHGGLAFGFDRLCAIIGGEPAIRNFIAFPKNNKGRDVMIKAPAPIDQKQMDELYLQSTHEEPVTQQDEGKQQH